MVVMTAANGFPVEDFLQAITSQLDRTQDSLRLKSVNRPLTYAIRDFSMELKVFVELSPDGRVMFRPSASDDTGASVVHIGFTTVNRTMIEENTVSLSAVKSPSLDELGLDEAERRQLEKLGVRNAAQLDQLKATTGENTVARYSGLPVSRLRQALAQSRPAIRTVTPIQPNAAPAQPITVAEPVTPPTNGSGGTTDQVRIPPLTRRLVLAGPRLDDVTRKATLRGNPLEVRPVAGGVEVDLGDHTTSGTLELDLGDEGAVALDLEFDHQNSATTPPDPWRST
jgi:hypothetical protein